MESTGVDCVDEVVNDLVLLLVIIFLAFQKKVTLTNPGQPQLQEKTFDNKKIWNLDGISLKIKGRRWRGQMCTYILLEKQQQTYNKNISSDIKKSQTDYMERFNISSPLH